MFAAEEAARWECCPSTTATKLLTPMATTEQCSSEINYRLIFSHLLQIQSSVWKQIIAKAQFTCLRPGLGISCTCSTLFSILWGCALSPIKAHTREIASSAGMAVLTTTHTHTRACARSYKMEVLSWRYKAKARAITSSSQGSQEPLLPGLSAGHPQFSGCPFRHSVHKLKSQISSLNCLSLNPHFQLITMSFQFHCLIIITGVYPPTFNFLIQATTIVLLDYYKNLITDPPLFRLFPYSCHRDLFRMHVCESIITPVLNDFINLLG